MKSILTLALITLFATNTFLSSASQSKSNAVSGALFGAAVGALGLTVIFGAKAAYFAKGSGKEATSKSIHRAYSQYKTYELFKNAKKRVRKNERAIAQLLEPRSEQRDGAADAAVEGQPPVVVDPAVAAKLETAKAELQDSQREELACENDLETLREGHQDEAQFLLEYTALSAGIGSIFFLMYMACVYASS